VTAWTHNVDIVEGRAGVSPTVVRRSKPRRYGMAGVLHGCTKLDNSGETVGRRDSEVWCTQKCQT